MRQLLQVICCIILLVSNICLAAGLRHNGISLNLQQIEINNLLHLVALHAGKNIIVSPKIHGNLSLNLNNVGWQEALDIILAMAGLAKRESNNVIYIVPASDAAVIDNAQNKIAAVFSLRYAKAEEVANVLKPFNGAAHSGTLSADTRTNSLLVEDTPARIAELRQMAQAIDVPVRQVAIAARIVSIDAEFTRDLGLKFGTISQDSGSSSTTSNLDLDGNKLDPGHFTLTLARLGDDKLLDMELAALESEGRGKVISSPKLITAERKVAYIESGAEIPYQEKASRGATNVAFKKAVLSLKVKPEIMLQQRLNLTLVLSQDKVSQLTVNGVPAIDTRKIQTQVAVRNGETIVLGGIYEWANSEGVTKIPVVGDIPVLGSIFKDRETKRSRKELLIFITPTIVG